MKRIAFIACSKTKKRSPSPAGDLYQGTLFKKAKEYCAAHFDEVYILSAKYGMLPLTTIIEPYEQTLKHMSVSERRDWANMVKQQMSEMGIMGELWFFTGERYHESFSGKKPLIGLSLGRQLQWFNEHLYRKGGFGL